jgi:hypothetical protein
MVSGLLVKDDYFSGLSQWSCFRGKQNQKISFNQISTIAARKQALRN